jgi:hypothetical protein
MTHINDFMTTFGAEGSFPLVPQFLEMELVQYSTTVQYLWYGHADYRTDKQLRKPEFFCYRRRAATMFQVFVPHRFLQLTVERMLSPNLTPKMTRII